MIKKILLTFFLVSVQTVVFGATKTYIGPNNGVWNTAANWSPSGVPSSSDDVIIPTGNTVTVNVNAQAKSIVVVGNLTLATTYTLIVYGDFTVTAATTGPNVPEGNFKIVENGNSTTTLIVLGNYINNGKTDFDKGDVIIVGNLITPETSTLQNLGNVIVGGDIIGDFNLQGSIQTNQQIYAVNPNATVTITPDNIDKDVVPGTPVTTTTESSTLVDLVNLYIYGGNCTFMVNNIANVSACLGSNAVFTVTTNASSPQYQWQVKMNGPGWTNLTNVAPYSGVNTATLTISGVTAAMNNYQYRAKVTGGSPSSCTKNGNYGVLTVNALPIADAGLDFTKSCTTNISGATIGMASVVGTTYSWNPATGLSSFTVSNPTANPTVTTTYTLTSTITSTGCKATDTVMVTVNTATPSDPSVTTTQPTCTLATGTITVTVQNVGETYSFDNGSTFQPGNSKSGFAAGNYNVIIKSTDGCNSLATSVTITSPDKTWNGSISADWNTAANWTPSGVPTSSNCVTIPSATRSPIISGTSFVAYANNLTLLSSGILTVKSSNTIIVTDFVDVELGFLTFENTASLVQINDVENKGFIDYQRITNARPTDYTYWSSPVSPMSLGEFYPLGSSFYSYEATATGEDWKQENSGTDMIAGKGYIANRGAAIPSPGPPPPPDLLNVTFNGIPNNGHYEINGIFANKSYLLGNPYPSALDADKFLAANAAVLNGTLYFWTHNTQIGIGVSDPGTGLYAYSGDDYATYNATGGVGAAPPDLDPLTGQPYPGSAPSGSPVPTGKIASGQGFFASSKTSLSGTKIVFDNTMRVGVNGITGNNSQFFKTKNPIAKTAKTIEKSRVWLNLTNTQGAFKQTLIGYVSDATNDYDSRFDGESFDGNEFVDFYSVNQDKNLVIQGRALPFDVTDEVPLGFRTTINGAFTINIDQADGLLINQAVFIEDKLTNTVFDLKSGNYTFSTVAGIFNDRFVLKYSNKTLGTETFDSLEKTVLVSNKNKQIKINSSVEMINMVTIFDLLGRQIYQKVNINSNELSISNLVLSHQIVMVKTVLQNGETVTKKIIY